MQDQGVEGLVAVPGAVRPLPRGQCIRQSLGSLGSDLVVCSTNSNILRAPPSGHSAHCFSPFKGEQGRQQQREGGFGEHVDALFNFRVLRALLQCQVPSDPSRGARASAMTLTPSAGSAYPVKISGHSLIGRAWEGQSR